MVTTPEAGTWRTLNAPTAEPGAGGSSHLVHHHQEELRRGFRPAGRHRNPQGCGVRTESGRKRRSAISLTRMPIRSELKQPAVIRIAPPAVITCKLDVSGTVCSMEPPRQCPGPEQVWKGRSSFHRACDALGCVGRHPITAPSLAQFTRVWPAAQSAKLLPSPRARLLTANDFTVRVAVQERGCCRGYGRLLDRLTPGKCRHLRSAGVKFFEQERLCFRIPFEKSKL